MADRDDGRWAIWTEGLTKDFGRLRAVEGADLRVAAGRIYGFVGPNGSGKTTVIAMLLGLIRPSRGRLRLLGREPDHPAFAKVLTRVGALVQAPAFYPFLSGRDNLRVLGSVRRPVSVADVDRALERVGLLERAGDRYQSYSLGMRQRLAIALALLGDPELIILDEPTNGLDPVGIREIRALIRSLGEEGRTVFLSSHLLHEVEQTCDEVGVILRGRLVAQGPVRELLGGRGFQLRVSADGAAAANRAPGERACEVLRALPWRPRVQVSDGYVWVDAPPERGAELTRALAGAGLWVSEMVPVRSTLEQYFFEVAAGQVDGFGAGDGVRLPRAAAVDGAPGPQMGGGAAASPSRAVHRG